MDMGRKRNDKTATDAPVDAEGNVMVATESNGQVDVVTVDPPAETPTKPELPKNRPVASFIAQSDRTTRLEVAAWGRTIKVDDEEIIQYALTFRRSWRDKEGTWNQNGSYRVHDVPVLLFLVQQAYHWCVLQRTDISIASDEPLPF
jgi:hypothetical protein